MRENKMEVIKEESDGDDDDGLPSLSGHVVFAKIYTIKNG